MVFIILEILEIIGKNFILNMGIAKAKVPNEASCAWEPNLINFPILGKKMVKIEKLGNQKA